MFPTCRGRPEPGTAGVDSHTPSTTFVQHHRCFGPQEDRKKGLERAEQYEQMCHKVELVHVRSGQFPQEDGAFCFGVMTVQNQESVTRYHSRYGPMLRVVSLGTRRLANGMIDRRLVKPEA